MCSWEYLWQSQRCDSYQQGVPSWGGREVQAHWPVRQVRFSLGSSSKEGFQVLVLILLKSLARNLAPDWSFAFCYPPKPVVDVRMGVSQLSLVGWLLAWCVVSSEAGLGAGSLVHAGMRAFCLYRKQHLAVTQGSLRWQRWAITPCCCQIG